MDQTRFDELARGLATGATRRRVFQGVAAAVVGGVGLTAAGSALARKGKKGVRAQGKGNGKGRGQEKVEVCHKPGTPAEQTLVVAAPALKAHLAHGDTEGPCCTGPCCDGGDACGTTEGRECGTDASETPCYCASTVEGGGNCFLGDPDNCARNECTTSDADDDTGCAAGEACVPTAGCCGDKAAICIPFCNPAA